MSSVLKTKEELSGNDEELQSEVSLTNCWLVHPSFSIVQMCQRLMAQVILTCAIVQANCQLISFVKKPCTLASSST